MLKKLIIFPSLGCTAVVPLATTLINKGLMPPPSEQKQIPESLSWRKYWLENCRAFNKLEETIFVCLSPRSGIQPDLYYYKVRYTDKELQIPLSVSAIQVKSLSYQIQEDTLVAELIDRSKEFMKDFPKEFRQLSPDYSLDVRKDCRLDKSKLKGKRAPLSCRLREDGEFIDISLENSSDFLEPDFIVST